MGDETVNQTTTPKFSRARDVANFLIAQGWDEVFDEEEGVTEKLSEIQWAEYSYYIDGCRVYRTQGTGTAELIWTKI